MKSTPIAFGFAAEDTTPVSNLTFVTRVLSMISSLYLGVPSEFFAASVALSRSTGLARWYDGRFLSSNPVS